MHRSKKTTHKSSQRQNIDNEANFQNPFDQMMQEFRFPRFGMGFGGFDNDFFGGFGSFNRGFDAMRNEMFSNFDSMSRGQDQGTVIQKSYVQKVKYNPNGEPEKETFQTQSIKQIDQTGRQIREKQEAYQNTKSGVEKASHQRMLDKKGHKYIKERNKKTGEEQEENIFKGVKEDEMENFNKEYNDYRQKVNFDKNYQYLNNRRALGSGTSSGVGANNRAKALPDKYSSKF